MNLPLVPLLLALAAPVAGSESLPTKEVLTLRVAKAIADAAEATVVADPYEAAAASAFPPTRVFLTAASSFSFSLLTFG